VISVAPPTEVVPETTPSVEETVVGEGEEGTPEEAKPTRQLKRMSVAQVRDSMERISGGVPWGSETTSKWDEYSGTLGVADYQLRVESDRSPSTMYQKFLDDAAVETCLGWIQAENSSFFTMADPQSTTRVEVQENIIDLRWQIQGKRHDPSARIIADYEALFFKVHQRTDSTVSSWQAVCVAMFTHPDFFMY
jgi:hypothetical protein